MRSGQQLLGQSHRAGRVDRGSVGADGFRKLLSDGRSADHHFYPIPQSGLLQGIDDQRHFVEDREYINATFMGMAICCGLTCPITNPLLEPIKLAILAADLCMGRDEFATNWIGAYRQRRKARKT